VLAELPAADEDAVSDASSAWSDRGVDAVARTVGGLYGIRGRPVDTRRILLLAPAGDEPAARELAAGLRVRHGIAASLFADVQARPRGRVEVTDEDGRLLAVGDGLVGVIAAGEGAVDVGAGRYRGRVALTIDAGGRLAAVNLIGLEPLLRGLVPSEIPASAPTEALRAQAITARSNVLAQLGTRHLADPWALCDEVHCQAYRGAVAEAPATDAAVKATAGQVIVDREGRLVDGVYSAACGGHGEDAHAVWERPPSASLRGGPDLRAGAARWASGLAEEQRLREFLRDPPPAWCAVAPAGRFRWTRSLPQAELDRLAAPLGIGAVRELRVLRRGASGRALELAVEGSQGRVDVRGELAIRRLLGDLHSAMFVVDRAGTGVVLRGGGWGHGAGLCQWGAIGRARAGQGHREILRAYFAGATVVGIY
jgi:SpoIID/LytB domain protein